MCAARGSAVDVPGEAAGHKVVQDRAADRARPAAGADHRDCRRLQYRYRRLATSARLSRLATDAR